LRSKRDFTGHPRQGYIGQSTWI